MSESTAETTTPELDGGTPATPLVPGKMYLHLFHGRNAPDEQLDDWGFDGPRIGPLSFFHGTYMATLRIGFETKADAARFGLDQHENFLDCHEDMLKWGGKFYGDWDVSPYRTPEQEEEERRQIRYDLKVNHLLKKDYGVTWADGGDEDAKLVDARLTGETPEEFVDRWATKYGLVPVRVAYGY